MTLGLFYDSLFGQPSRTAWLGQNCCIVRRFGLLGVVVLDDAVMYRTEEGSVPSGRFSGVEEDVV